jgi:hypothetical protein
VLKKYTREELSGKLDVPYLRVYDLISHKFIDKIRTSNGNAILGNFGSDIAVKNLKNYLD